MRALDEYRFCPRCGGALERRILKEIEPERLVCRACDFIFFLNPKIAAGTLFQLEGKLLLLKRAIEPGYGKWVFPGGFVDRGETVVEAAIRETREEANVEVQVRELVDVYSYSGSPVVVVVYAADVVSGEPRAADESLEIQAFGPEEIPWEELAFPSTRDALREYVRRFFCPRGKPQKKKEEPLNRFAGKVALVTGASRGIGRAISNAYLEEGAKVALCARSLAELEALAERWNRKDRRALALKCDVTSREEVARALDEVEGSWGKLHILVNNAGISGRTPLDSPAEDTDELWERILATNLRGAYLVSRRALPLMSSGAGRIINMSSVLGRFGVAGYTAYCTAKHGIIGFTRALALELAPRGITVNALCPGWVQTDMAEQGIRETAAVLGISPEEFREQAIAEVPLKRFIDASEVAKLVLYLSSDEGSAITGQAYNICGGQVMN